MIMDLINKLLPHYKILVTKGTGRGGDYDIETILRTVRGWLMDARNLIETDRARLRS